MMTGVLLGAKGLGPKRIQALEAAGLTGNARLLRYFPVRYTDYTCVRRVSGCIPGEDAVLEVTVTGKPSQARIRGRVITRAVLSDETGSIRAVWFSQPWMFERLSRGGTLTVFGRVEERKGRLCLACPRLVEEKRLTGAYKPIEGVPDKLLRSLIAMALASPEAEQDTLPEEILREYGLPGRKGCLKSVHLPEDRDSLEAALRRFSFEDTLNFMLCALKTRTREERGTVIVPDEADLREFYGRLGFPLTAAQKRVLGEICDDMAKPRSMARLVQGDVGCGKTAVAFGAICAAARRGFQCAMMAPTEILAGQHYESARRLLEPMGISCGLLTGSMTGKERKHALAEIASGRWHAVFGTHALISPGVEYENLGLVITDEQHRFGVRQRTRLGEKGDRPNVLVMSATPIPRTLALILYGDLDLSIIDELPAGRKPVATRIVPEDKRQDMYGFIARELENGKQAYFVCPLIEDSETLEAESAESLFMSMTGGPLEKYGLRLVNGKMSPAEKEEALEDFRTGRARVLVSTTVIEVGINVPSATVMVIENAERFGLAQLHQLRGRVGRGSDAAWCFLMAKATERLKVLTATNDGFLIAQKDMELRGPGDLFGTRQAGAPSGLSVDAARDTKLLETVHRLAARLIEQGGDTAERMIAAAEEWLQEKNDVIFAQN